MIGNIFFFLFFVSLNSQEKEPFENAKINFLYDINHKENKAYLTFNSRWDFNDARKLYFLPLSFYKSAQRINLSKDVKFKYYGYGIKPFRIINIQRFSKTRPDISGNKNISSQDKEMQPENKSAVSSERKKGFISLSPLYEDLTENVYDFILENSIKPLSSQWGSLSKQEKKEFFMDLYSTGIFNGFIFSPLGDMLYEISNKHRGNTKKKDADQTI